MNRYAAGRRASTGVTWLAAVAALLPALPPDARAEPVPGISGWQEAVLSVDSLERWETFWVNNGGWQVVSRGETDPDWLRVWGLPPDTYYREVLLRNPGTESGYIRIVAFANVPKLQIRSNGQPWETGGIFDINVRVVDLDSNFRDLQQAGWQGFADPVQFEFGGFVVREWLGRGPDGVVLALIERVAPPLDGWPELRHFSRAFNSTQIVQDIEASLAFYRDTLGFRIYVETEGSSATAGPNVLGLPHNLADRISRRTIILHPTGQNDGSVELIEFDGVEGRDFAARARPPNLGVMALRFPVTDLQTLAARLLAAGVEPAAGPRRARLLPYGEVEVLAAVGPNGEWLEFFEP